MATRKITITLGEDQVNAVRKLMAAGHAKSVSGFVQHAVSVALADAEGWAEMLAQALQVTGGPLTNKERAWADRLLKSPARARRKRRAA